MKKTFLFLFLLFYIAGFSQQIQPLNVFKVIIGKDLSSNDQYTIGIDLGIVESSRMYTKMDVSANFNQALPSYINFGTGYLFKNNFYVTPLIGVYVKSNEVIFNAGGEIGFISNKIVTAIFCTNNRVGIKIGIALPNKVDL